MRRIGGDLTQEQADRFSDYLFTRNIHVVSEPAGDGSYDVWAREEDQLDVAREELAQFRSDPDAARYRVDRKANELRRRQEKEQREKLKLQQQFKPKRVPGAPGTGATSLVIVLIIACVAASLLTNFGQVTPGQRARAEGESPFAERLFNQLTLLPSTIPVDELDPGEDIHPLWAVMRGEVWRLVTPILLHGSIMHLLFNCLMLFQLGRILEMLRGPWFMLALFLVGGVAGIFAQAYGPMFLGGGTWAIGASGGVLALFTYLWLRPMVDPGMPFRIPPFSVAIVFGFVFLAMVPGFIPGVANLAHLAGIAVGAIAAAGAFEFLNR